MDYQKELFDLIESRKEEVYEISDKVWEYAEPRFQEFRSAKLEADFLEANGFKVQRGLCGEDTAYLAEFGSGQPVIAMLGEYDALSGLSQEADIDEKKPIIEGGQGHGCGHNLLGAGPIASALAIKAYMEKHGTKGTLRVYGCPAEENAGGKEFLARDGAFDDVDICMSWHPGTSNFAVDSGCLANFRIFYTFHGLSSHAAGAPHLGRSALDAVELMDVGVNYMREHMIDEARIHYAIIDTGGTAPNVVQSQATVLYAIRAPKVTDVKELAERVNNCARGAALMTGTTVDIRHVAAYSDYVANDVVKNTIKKHMEELLPLDYTDEEIAYAQKFHEAITELDKVNLKKTAEMEAGKDWAKLVDMPIWNFYQKNPGKMSGSNDAGAVSYKCPFAFFFTATSASGTPGHSWQNVAQGKGPVAKKGMLFAAKVMAAACVDFFEDPELVKAAKEEWNEVVGPDGYPDPLPKGSKPEIW